MRGNASHDRPLYSGELAQLAGVSRDTLRYYERQHLLPDVERSAAGYRLYRPQAVLRVRMIRGALAIGFSVSELAAIFGERDRGGAPCHQVRTLAAKKLAGLDAQLRDLQRWRTDLRKTLAGWDRLLGKTQRGERAGLLEAFVASHPKRQNRGVKILAGGKRKQEK